MVDGAGHQRGPNTRCRLSTGQRKAREGVKDSGGPSLALGTHAVPSMGTVHLLPAVSDLSDTRCPSKWFFFFSTHKCLQVDHPLLSSSDPYLPPSIILIFIRRQYCSKRLQIYLLVVPTLSKYFIPILQIRKPRHIQGSDLLRVTQLISQRQRLILGCLLPRVPASSYLSLCH